MVKNLNIIEYLLTQKNLAAEFNLCQGVILSSGTKCSRAYFRHESFIAEHACLSRGVKEQEKKKEKNLHKNAT